MRADYVYHEYPKHIEVAGHTITVNNEDEEREALGSGKLVDEASERKRLMEVVKVRNVPSVDGRWKIERIEAAIRNAGHDPAFDPFA